MKISEQKKGDIMIYQLEGDINLNTSPLLRKAFDTCTGGDIKTVVVNFQAVPYIDSSGLATLIELLQRLKRSGAQLKICSLTDKVKNVFEVTRLHKLFEIFDNEESALEDSL